MIPLLRDVIRNVTNPAVAIVLVVLALSGASAVQLSAGTPLQVTPPSGIHVAVTYNFSGGYRFNVLAFTKPSETSFTRVADAQVEMQFETLNGTGTVIGQTSGTTNSQGFLSLTWASAPCDCDFVLNVTAASGVWLGEIPLADPPPQNLTPLMGVFTVVPSGFFLSKPLLVVAFPDDNGQVPPGVNLTYSVPSLDPGVSPAESARSLGPLTSVLQPFPSVQSLALSDFDTVQFNLTGQRGSTIYSWYAQFAFLDPKYVTETNAAASLEAGVQTVSFLAALAGALIGFVGYGRDRLTGTLDPVLALPVTRSRLLLSRYSSAVIVAIAGSVIGALVLGFTVSNVAGGLLPATVWLALVATVVVDSLAFVGLAFLGAHLTKSSTLLLVALILVAAAMTILWVPFVSTVTHFTAISANMSTLEGQSALVGWSPGQTSISVLGAAVLNFNGEGPYLFTAVTNPGTLATLAVCWSAIPIAMAWLLFRYRD